MMHFEEIGYGAEIRVGRKTFRVFRNEGVVKLATLAGTAGKKMYKLAPRSWSPLVVEAAQIVEISPEKLGPVVAFGPPEYA